MANVSREALTAKPASLFLAGTEPGLGMWLQMQAGSRGLGGFKEIRADPKEIRHRGKKMNKLHFLRKLLFIFLPLMSSSL